jgi:NAD(P)H-nitrite reductase large subunit
MQGTVITRDGLTTVVQVGARTSATTGCVGCYADERQLVATASAPVAARQASRRPRDGCANLRNPNGAGGQSVT